MKIGFIIGTPRSGKSRVFEALVSSGNFAWISEYHNYFNIIKLSSLINKIYDIPLIGYRLYKINGISKYLPHPIETNSFWEKKISQFNSPNKSDISMHEIDNIRELIKNSCSWQGKELFISEYSKWSRVNEFTKVDPAAKFLHLTRDGRAVAYEYYKMIVNSNYNEWNMRQEWIESWPQTWKDDFEKYSDSVLVYCVYLWKFQLMKIKEETMTLHRDQYLEIRYEDLVKDPEYNFLKIADFFEMKFNKRLSDYIINSNFRNMNYEWEQELTPEQKNILNDIINETDYLKYLDV
ncbi:hypothetical protein IRB23SM22_20880 [Alkalibacterium sp. s-m-22]